jgi:hypothetical protein
MIACSVQLHNFCPFALPETLALILVQRRAHPCLHARMSCTNGWAHLEHCCYCTSLELRLGARCTTDSSNEKTAPCCTSHGGRPPYTRLDLQRGDFEGGRCSAADGYHSCAKSKLATSLDGEEYQSLVGAELRAASDGGAASEFVSSR